MELGIWSMELEVEGTLGCAQPYCARAGGTEQGSGAGVGRGVVLPGLVRGQVSGLS